MLVAVPRWAALTVCAVTGCSQPAAAPSAAHSNEARPPEAVAVDPSAIELAVVDRDGLDSIVEQRHGQVVLVDFWATWCGPCVQQLAHTAELANDGPAGVAVVTVAMEDPDDADAVKKVLSARGLTGSLNLISQDGGGSPAMAAFEIEGGALPHYKLYDRKGELRRTFALDPSADTQFTTADVDTAIDELLAE